MGYAETAIIAAVISAVLGAVMIPLLRRLKFGQSIREEGPGWHKKKSGTPTMGGLIFIPATVAAVLFVTRERDVAAVLICALAFGAIGFADDYIIIVKKRNLGLTVMQKLSSQLLVSTAFVLYALYTGIAGDVMIPFSSGYLNLGMWFIPLAVIFMTFTVNSVNLTDGLDGLASSVTIISAVFFAAAASHMGAEGITVLCMAVIGSLAGFLIYNLYPAKVFMGDTGSLFLGGFVSAVSIILGLEIFFIIAGAVFMIEAISVILQVASFKLTGKRIFRMSPIHHHFVMLGFSESGIVALFVFASIVFAGAAYLGMIFI